MRQNAHHVFFRLADREAANGEAVEVDVFQTGQGFLAQGFVHAALNNPEQGVGIFQAVVLIARTACPAQRQAHRFGGGFVIGRVGRAFVKDHDDVAVQILLDLHGDFRSQEQLGAIDGRCKLDAFFGDLAQIAQRKHLKAAGISKNWFVPVHELVQTTELFNHFHAWAKPEVEGITQADLRAGGGQCLRRHGFDGAIGAHRHKGRGIDLAMRQSESAAAGCAVGGDQIKIHEVCSVRVNSMASP